MREKEFNALVNRLEVYEREHPAAYKLRVALLAAFGYLIVFGVLVITLLFFAVVIYTRKINPLIVAVGVILVSVSALIIRSLWIESGEPQGKELSYDDAPRLFDLLNEMQRTIECPRLHKVLLTEHYNAFIVQVPRLGVFGSRNYLLIGLPLLRALSLAAARAILAHEFGHLSENHGRFYTWIYRLRQTWQQLLNNMQQHSRNFSLVERFVRWYAPYFEAYSFVLARAQEYEADRCSVTVSGKEISARALINLKLKGKLFDDEFWPGVCNLSKTQPEPPAESFSDLLQTLREPLPLEKAKLWFAETLTMRHRYHDTHPTLAERLASMGYPDIRKSADLESFVIADDEPPADQILLARLPEEFIEQQNKVWQEYLSEGWNERHKFVSEAEQKLAAFAEKNKTTALTIEELWERAQLMLNKEGSIVAIPLLQEVVALKPDHPEANYYLGDALLTEGDESGIKHLEAAMANEAHAVPASCNAIVEFLIARERDEDADRYRDRLSDYHEEVERGHRERNKLSKKDTFVPHDLTGEALEKLREELANVPLLSSAYLVRKVCKHFPDDPAYILGVISKRVFGLQLDSRDQKVLDQLAEGENLPKYTFIFPLERKYKRLRKVFKRIDCAEIYRAS